MFKRALSRPAETMRKFDQYLFLYSGLTFRES